MLGLGDRVDNGNNLSCKSLSFHIFSMLVPFSFHSFSSLYLLIIHNLSLIRLSEFFLWNFNFHMHFILAGHKTKLIPFFKNFCIFTSSPPSL